MNPGSVPPVNPLDWIAHWPEAVLVLNDQGHCLAANPALYRLLGLASDTEAHARTAHALVCGGDHARHAEAQCPLHPNRLQTHDSSPRELWCPDAEGLFQLFDGRLLPLPPHGWLLQLSEVPPGTASLAQASRIARFTDEGTAPLLEVDSSGTVLYANQAMTDLMADHGFASDGLAVVLPSDFHDCVQAVLRDGSPRQADSLLLTGETFAWRFSRADGPPPVVHVQGFETTALVQALQALERQKETYRLTLNVAREGVMDWRTGAEYTEVSDRCFDMLGKPVPREPSQRFEKFLALLKPDDARRLIDRWQRVACGLQSRFEVTVEACGRQGEGHWLIIRGKAVEQGSHGGTSRLIASVADISQVRQYQDTVRRQRASLDQTTHGVALLRPDGSIEYANPRWSSWFGECESARVTELPAAVAPALARALAQGLQGQTSEFRCALTDIDQPLWLTCFPLRGADDRVEGVVAFARDIRADERKEQAISEARIRSEAALLVRDRALRAMELELKEPTGQLLLAMDLLEHCDLEPKAAGWIEIARQALARLQRIETHLFESLRSDSGLFVPNPETFAFHELLNRIRTRWQSLCSSRGLGLSWRGTDGRGQQAFADPAKLEQLLNALFGLSLNYTRQGVIAVSVQHVARPEAAGRLQVEIRDTSPGFMPEERAALEQPFALVADADGRLSLETSLALGLCRRLTRMLEGELQLESVPGEGSCYRLDIPFDLQLQKEQTPTSARFPAAIDTTYLSEQTRRVGLPFLAVLKDVMESLRTLANDLPRQWLAGDPASRRTDLESLQRRADNFALRGLAHCTRHLLEQRDTEGRPDPSAFEASAPPASLIECLAQTLAVLDDTERVLREELTSESRA